VLLVGVSSVCDADHQPAVSTPFESFSLVQKGAAIHDQGRPSGNGDECEWPSIALQRPRRYEDRKKDTQADEECMKPFERHGLHRLYPDSIPRHYKNASRTCCTASRRDQFSLNLLDR
jgi:hypothetical protein